MDSLIVTRAQAKDGADVRFAVKGLDGKYSTTLVQVPGHSKNRDIIPHPPTSGRSYPPRSIRLRVPNWGLRNGVAMAPALAGLIGYAWQYVIAFTVAWAVFCFCARYSRRHGFESFTGSFRQKIRATSARSALIYLTAAEVAIGFFLFLALIVTRFRSTFTIGQLQSLHNTFTAYSSFWDQWIKLEDIWLLVAYIAVWAATTLLLLWRRENQTDTFSVNSGPSWRRGTVKSIHRIVDVHGRFAGPVSLALALLASFTFISAAVVPLSTQLHSQLTLRLSQKEERLRAQEAGRARDYMQAVRQVTADLNAQVVAHVNIRVQESMPPSYKRMLSDTRFQNQVDRINSGTSQLGKTLHQIDPEAARVLAMENARTQNLQDLSDQLPESSPDGRLPTSAPAHVTASQAAAARKWVKEDSGEDVFDLLEADNDQITLQMGTTFISSPFWKNIKTAFKGKFPFAEPMIDILSSTIGDQLQETIYEKVAPIVKDVVNRTGNARAQISAVAQNISAKVNVASMVRAHAEEIINVTAEREADLTRLTDGANQVSYYAQIVREKNKLVLESVIDPIGLEFSPAGGDLITRGDFDPALTAILNSSEPVQAEVVKELASLSQASDSELLQLWQSYNMRVDSGALDTGDVDASGEPIVTDPVSLKHNAAHVLQFLAPDLPGVVTSGDLNIANANCGCS